MSQFLCLAYEIIYSQEGTTQGDPPAMAMYAIDVSPLISHMSTDNSTREFRYAGGSTEDVGHWWSTLVDVGPRLDTTWLLVKDNLLDNTRDIFMSTSVYHHRRTRYSWLSHRHR